MKTERIIFVLFAMFALTINAQSDYSSYLNKAMEKLEAGDCESAQKFYNVYKDLSGEQKPSVQVLIDDCKEAAVKKYAIGERIKFKGYTFKVAYLEPSKEHGFAICDNGYSKHLYSSQMFLLEDAHLITLSELNRIIPNKNFLQLSGNYWTSTVAKTSSNIYDIRYYVKNIETGKELSVDCSDEKNGRYYLLYVITF
ncbi:MAG: hypothetical protein K5660_07630 [Paludibacteraceae bacterium]|nr:hypothetical protein [Paludibacteraceae bacterium]